MNVNEVLQKAGEYLESRFGVNTLLLNPEANKGATIVKLLTGWANDIAELSKRVDGFEASRNPNYLAGNDLINYAAERGIIASENTTTKIQVIAAGEAESIVPEGTILLDSHGNEYSVKADITVDEGGIGLGVACSEDGVCANPQPGTVYPRDSVFNMSITNGITLERGGAIESDDALRRRLLAQQPMWAIQGTADAAINDLYLAGVDFAKYGYVDSCGYRGYMFVIHGGEDCAICDALKIHASGATILGDKQCNCSDIRFQRACPVLIKVRVTLDCDTCTRTDEATVKLKIMQLANKIARGDKVKAIDIGKVDRSIDKVELQTRPMLLGCASELEITDPISGSPLPYASENSTGFCKGVIECDNEWRSAIRVEFWQYPVIDVNYIEIVEECIKPDEVGCSGC